MSLCCDTLSDKDTLLGRLVEAQLVEALGEVNM